MAPRLASSCCLHLFLYLPILLLLPFLVASEEDEYYEDCYDFSPPLSSPSDEEAAAFLDCFKDAYHLDHVEILIEEVDLVFAEDDDGGVNRRRRLGRKAKKVKVKGKCNKFCKHKNVEGDGDCVDCGRFLERDNHMNLRGDVGVLGRQLNTPFPTKSYTEYLVDSCVHFVNDHDGFLGDLVGGVSIVPTACIS